MALHGSDPFTWRRIVRRARLGSTVKLVACILADYANPDGTSVRPGNVRLTLTTELADKTVRRALETLRSVGLIERVFVGSKMGRRGLADEYRLTIPDNLLERVAMLDPDEQVLSPVPVTGDQPVDNSASPVTVTGDEGRTEDGTPVTEDGTPVTEDRNTGHGDRPPNQAPTSTPPTNKNDGLSDHGAGLEGSTASAAATIKDRGFGFDFRSACAYLLQAPPDVQAAAMARAAEELPGADNEALKIRAAEIASKGIPA